jgi:hypothetical protein
MLDEQQVTCSRAACSSLSLFSTAVQDEWLRMTRAPSTSGSATAGSVVSAKSRVAAALAGVFFAMFV